MISSLRSMLEDITLHGKTPIYSTEETPLEDKKVLAIVDSLGLGWTWTIYEAEFTADDIRFFGMVNGSSIPELGYFYLSDLQTDGLMCDVSFDGVHPDEYRCPENGDVDDFAVGGLDVSLN